MKSYLTGLWLASALAGIADGQARLNRLQLDNGGESLDFFNDPFIGSDPANGNFSGDLYWKVVPRQSIQRASGASTLWGTEQSIFDQDWLAGTTLWAYAIRSSVVGTDNTIRPALGTTGPGVFVPETPIPFPPPAVTCAPGYIAGWTFYDLFADTGTGSFIPLMQATDPGADDYFRSDGTVDWSFVHFFPGGQSLTSPSPNSCGSGFAGDATFMWFASTDERQGPATDGPALRSRYGGSQDGTVGVLTPEAQSRGAELAFFISGSPTQNLRVNTQYLPCLPEIGLAGLEMPIGWDTVTDAPADKDCDQFPGSTFVTIGTRNYDHESTTGFTLGAHAANIDTAGGATDLLIDLGACIPFMGAPFCVNPANSIFMTTFSASISPAGFYTGPTAPAGPDESPEWNSPQYPVAPDPCLLGVTIGWQGFSIEPVSLQMRGTQVSRQTLRANTGL